MGDYYRSKSYGDGRMEMEVYYAENGKNINNGYEKPTNFTSSNPSNNVGFQDLRCYSASYATSTTQQQQIGGGVAQIPRELKKGKSANASTSSSRAGWCFSDPEMQRRKRVASYKSYSVEGKIKRSFSRSFRWIKDKVSGLVI